MVLLATCTKLRWKGMYVDVPQDPTVAGTTSGFCWCQHTMTCLGPDGHVADRTRCGPDRSCFDGLLPST